MAKKKRKKRKDPYKYKKTIINKLIDENKDRIIKGYFQSINEDVPKYKKDQKIAIAAFKDDIFKMMKNESNRELTASELFKKEINLEKFTSKEERLLENFYQAQKKIFNYTVERTYINKKEGTEYVKKIVMPRYKRDQIVWDEDKQLYKIAYGKDEGKYFIIIHNPGSYPSFKMELKDAEEVDKLYANGQLIR